MNEAVVKDEVIEEAFNFTFINDEFVGVKQEEIEQKPEYLIEKEIKTEPIDFFETNESDEFSEDTKPEPKESDSKIETVSTGITKFKCEICLKTMSKECSKLIKSEENKIVLAEIFKIEGSLEKRTPYVCVAHIQTIIGDYDGKVKFAGTIFERLLRSFITKHKKLMRKKKSRSRICKICHISKTQSELYDIKSNGIRIVMMVGCILRGTHSVEQAINYIKNNNWNNNGTCYSHCGGTTDWRFPRMKL